MNFVIEGIVKPKERPRTRHFNGRTYTYTPKATQEYEKAVKAAYTGSAFDSDIPLKVIITAYLPIPKSVSKIKREAMIAGSIRPVKTPDADNIAKAICDALNGVAYADDKQIVRLVVEKWYSTYPRAEVTITEEKQ